MSRHIGYAIHFKLLHVVFRATTTGHTALQITSLLPGWPRQAIGHLSVPGGHGLTPAQRRVVHQLHAPLAQILVLSSLGHHTRGLDRAGITMLSKRIALHLRTSYLTFKQSIPTLWERAMQLITMQGAARMARH